MPCFYCGKNIPVLRKFSDPDFCCDEHRARYQELAKVALNRLLASTAGRARSGRGKPASPSAPPAACSDPAALTACLAPKRGADLRFQPSGPITEFSTGLLPPSLALQPRPARIPVADAAPVASHARARIASGPYGAVSEPIGSWVLAHAQAVAAPSCQARPTVRGFATRDLRPAAALALAPPLAAGPNRPVRLNGEHGFVPSFRLELPRRLPAIASALEVTTAPEGPALLTWSSAAGRPTAGHTLGISSPKLAAISAPPAPLKSLGVPKSRSGPYSIRLAPAAMPGFEVLIGRLGAQPRLARRGSLQKVCWAIPPSPSPASLPSNLACIPLRPALAARLTVPASGLALWRILGPRSPGPLQPPTIAPQRGHVGVLETPRLSPPVNFRLPAVSTARLRAVRLPHQAPLPLGSAPLHGSDGLRLCSALLPQPPVALPQSRKWDKRRGLPGPYGPITVRPAAPADWPRSPERGPVDRAFAGPGVRMSLEAARRPTVRAMLTGPILPRIVPQRWGRAKSALEPAERPRLERAPLFPKRLAQPVMLRFTVPPPEPLQVRLLRTWKSLPGVLRAALGVALLLGAPGYSLWRLAGGPLSRQIERRAVILVHEEFRDGLDHWTGVQGWRRTWSHGPTAYVEVGRLAMLLPTQTLSDYQCEFLCGITGRGIGWAYRIRDFENYYASELAIVKPGPLPAVSLIRYTVAGGRKMEQVQIPLKMAIRTDRPLLVRLSARGDGFTTWIADQIVDFWQDDRFPRGGVGFFAEGADRPQLYWVRVSHNNDALGRLCALLAPRPTEGSKQ